MKKTKGFRPFSQNNWAPASAKFFAAAAPFALSLLSLPASAGVFTVPNFIQPGQNAFGVEPEVTFTHESGFGTNLRFQQGVTALSNAHILIGAGTGQRQFRVGGAYTFDFFPDINEQPGIGLGVQALYYRYNGDYGQFESTGIPYIHKAFDSGHGQIIEPFLSFPIGFEFREDTYDFIATLAFGARLYLDKKDPFSFVGELGLNLANTETYFSAGVVYTP